jgi:hypothetical protein
VSILTSLSSIVHAQAINWEERRAAEKNKSPFVSRIIEYKPAPGQFINQEGIGTPEAAQSIVGGLNGLVSLGGFGGYIIVGFDHTIWNDPNNPYGVDFTIVGNAMPNSSEPGIVMVMRDTNGNGIPDDGEWYELKGSNYDQPSTIHNYTITYKNPKSDVAADIPWTDNTDKSGTLKKVTEHKQPYYPLPEIFPDYPQDEVSFTGTLIDLDIDEDNPKYIRLPELAYGYADNHPFSGWASPFLPDDPKTVGILEGNGGDAFDIDWAVDKNDQPVYLEGIDFIKIYTAVNANVGWLGEVSTEVRAVIDVSPDNVLSAPAWSKVLDISVYPNPATEVVNIRLYDLQATRVEIWDTSGQLFYVNNAFTSDLLSIPIHDYPAGMYMVVVYEGARRILKRVVKN